MAVEDSEPLIFQERRDTWIDSFKTLREDYRKLRSV
jgi:hypothetical protein